MGRKGGQQSHRSSHERGTLVTLVGELQIVGKTITHEFNFGCDGALILEQLVDLRKQCFEPLALALDCLP